MKNLFLALSFVLSLSASADTFTTHYDLDKPADGATNWGPAVRDNYDLIDTQMFVNATTTSDHIALATGAHKASAISILPGSAMCPGTLNVQAYLGCIDTSFAPFLGSGAVSIGTAQTITGQKTFTTPIIESGFTAGFLRTNSSGVFSSSPLVGADLPAPSLSSLGGVQSTTAVSHQFLTGVSISGSVTQAQPAASDVSGLAASATTDTTNASNITSGTLPAAQLPNPTSGTLGGVKSLAAVTHQFLTSIGTNGTPTQAQPAASDVSGLATSATTDTTNASNISSGTLSASRLPAFTGDITTSAGSSATTLATVNSNVGSFGSSTSIPSITVNGKGLITAASGNAVIAPAGTLSGATLAAGVTASSLTSVGTIATGVWNGTAVDAAHGGTGQTSLTANNVILGNGTSAVQFVAPSTSGNVLTSNGTTWTSTAPAASIARVASYTGVGSGTGVPNNADTSPNSSYMTWTKISDTSNDFNTTTGVYTCPAVGDFAVHFTAGWNGSSTGYRSVSLTQAGGASTVVNKGEIASTAGYVNAPSIDFTFHCTAITDTIAPSMYQNSGGGLGLQTASGYSYFSVYRVK